MRDVTFSSAQCAVIALSKEVPNLAPNSLARLADIFLPNWSCGHPAALAVHIISPLQQQTLEGASSNPGHALQLGLKGKLSSHILDCRSVGIYFIPLVAATLGGLAENAKLIIHSIDKTIGERAASSELPTVPDTSFFIWPFPSWVAMPIYNCTAIQLPPSLDGLFWCISFFPPICTVYSCVGVSIVSSFQLASLQKVLNWQKDDSKKHLHFARFIFTTRRSGESFIHCLLSSCTWGPKTSAGYFYLRRECGMVFQVDSSIRRYFITVFTQIKVVTFLGKKKIRPMLFWMHESLCYTDY